LTEIFERFSQGGNAHTSYYQGTGIGLALSKEIIALHHGTIKAENLQPSGAAFIIQLLLGKKHYKELEVDFYLGGTDSGGLIFHQLVKKI
jgi:signal transduction histidine kinase